MRRWAVAGVVLFAAYAALATLMSPRGFLGTDTGGKVATLRAMERCGCADPDVGYWAEEWDPDGSLHPLYFTAHAGDRWVNLSTLPMTLAARPLFESFGYRGALVLPMLGAVAAAYAAAALARRAGADEWFAFWLVGLASPVTVYALDFWEHSIGVALMAWGVVLAYDVVERDRPRWARAAAAGALLGTAATMRTEALVYTAVIAVAALVVVRRRRRDVAPSIAAAVAAAAAFAAPVMANVALERVVIGGDVRSTRTDAAVALVGDDPAARVEEAAHTLVGLVGSPFGVVLGAAAALLLALAARRRNTDERFATAAVAGAGALYLVRFAGRGLGFVPGLFVAWPFAAQVGRRLTFPAVVALGAIPIVLVTQYRGGAAPQWAGRYLLTSGLLLTVAALPASVRRATAVLAVAVTALGVAWLAVRSHDVEATIATIESRPEPVIVSTVAHLAREGGATYGDRRWLTAVGDAAAVEAADVVADSGSERFVLVEFADRPSATIGGAQQDGPPMIVRLFDGVDLRLTSWFTRTGVRR